MNKKHFEFLNFIYSLFREEVLSFTDYLINFEEILDIDIKELLNIYSFLLEHGYIKALRQDQIYLTDKGLETLDISSL